MRAILMGVALAAALILSPSVGLHAQQPIVYYFTLTVDSTAGGVALSGATWTSGGASASMPASFQTCEARLETAEIRYRYDGGAPTSGEGILLEPNESLTGGRNEYWRALRLIRTGATSGTLKGQCRTAS